MKFTETPLKGAYIIELEPFGDHRGIFSRMFCRETFQSAGLRNDIVQVNFSRTNTPHALRGLHYQLPPAAETKILKCVRGKLFDVIVDIRRGSPTFLQHFSAILSEGDQKLIYIPEGFAHGFQTLEPNSEAIYFVTAAYTPGQERGIRFNDPLLNIPWPFEAAELSEKDTSHPLLNKGFTGIELS